MMTTYVIIGFIVAVITASMVLQEDETYDAILLTMFSLLTGIGWPLTVAGFIVYLFATLLVRVTKDE